MQEVIALRKHAFLQSLCNSNTHTTIALLDNEPAGFSTWTNPLQRPNLSRSLTFLERVVSKYYICRNWILSKLPRRFYNWLFISKLGEEYRLKWSTAGRKNSELFKDIIPFTVRNEGYWFLNHLFIKPEYQRKRIGFILLKDGLEKKIDRSELKAYTAASVEGRNLYAKVGFESVRVTEEGDEKSGTVISDIMCYTPGRDRGSDKK